MNWQRQKRLSAAASHAALIAMTIGLLFPVYWMVNTSLKGNTLYTDPFSWFPRAPDLEPYRFWLMDPSSNFWVGLRNSILSVAVACLFALPIGAMAGYALARWRTRWIDAVLLTIFLLQMMPSFVTAGPLFRQLTIAGMVGSLPGLFLIYIAMSLPLTILTVRNYLLALPGEIEEAALVDGANRWQIFWQIAMPLCKPALASSGLFIFVALWLEYILAQQLMRGSFPNLAILLIGFSNMGWSGKYRPDYMLSLGVLLMAPVVISFPLMRKYIVSGLSSGALKG